MKMIIFYALKFYLTGGKPEFVENAGEKN